MHMKFSIVRIIMILVAFLEHTMVMGLADFDKF